MKNNYGKDTNKYQQQAGKENRTPNSPTTGGYSKTGNDQAQKGGFDKSKTQQQPKQPNQPNQKQNNWGTGSINGDKNR